VECGHCGGGGGGGGVRSREEQREMGSCEKIMLMSRCPSPKLALLTSQA
jgi:hypothetical protein